VKRKSLTRLKSELWNKLRPEIDSNVLVKEIKELLQKSLGESARSESVAHNLALYLTQKYAVGHRKAGELPRLIEHYPEDLARFLEGISFKEYQGLLKNLDQLPQRKKKRRVQPKTKAEAVRRRKESRNRYECGRRHYREGLIIKEFGRPPQLNLVDLGSKIPPESPCLDILFSGGSIRMAGDWDSFENLFGEDRHKFPKSLQPRRSGRTKAYDLNAFVECLIHLLANRDGHEPWLPEGPQRQLVLRRIIGRAYRFCPGNADMLVESLRPFLV